MPHSNNLEFLTTLHAAQATSVTCQEALELAMKQVDDQGNVSIPWRHLFAIKSLLSLEDRIVKGLIEENQTLAENLEGFVKKALNAETTD